MTYPQPSPQDCSFAFSAHWRDLRCWRKLSCWWSWRSFWCRCGSCLMPWLWTCFGGPEHYWGQETNPYQVKDSRYTTKFLSENLIRNYIEVCTIFTCKIFTGKQILSCWYQKLYKKGTTNENQHWKCAAAAMPPPNFLWYQSSSALFQIDTCMERLLAL